MNMVFILLSVMVLETGSYCMLTNFFLKDHREKVLKSLREETEKSKRL